jgi:hypothetical protein
MPATNTAAALLDRMLLRATTQVVNGVPTVCALDADYPALSRAGMVRVVGNPLFGSHIVLTASGLTTRDAAIEVFKARRAAAVRDAHEARTNPWT